MSNDFDYQKGICLLCNKRLKIREILKKEHYCKKCKKDMKGKKIVYVPRVER